LERVVSQTQHDTPVHEIPRSTQADASRAAAASSAAENGGNGGRVEPFIDLASIDLNGVMMDQAAMQKLLPHRDVMFMLDSIVWHADDFTLAVAAKKIRDDEFWCKGHIPGRPILPGVLMVESGAQLASIMYYARVKTDKFAGFTRIEDTAFRGMVVPGDILYLVTREVKFSLRRFVADVQGVVDDKIVFESRVTGMLF
jgi:3-hydroxyacyl-[acyl-carrier-protein] dehydratase